MKNVQKAPKIPVELQQADISDWAENFSAQSGASIRLAVWNWCVKSLSPGARIFLSYFCSSNFFPPVLIFVFGPTICPWVSEDVNRCAVNFILIKSEFKLNHKLFNSFIFTISGHYGSKTKNEKSTHRMYCSRNKKVSGGFFCEILPFTETKVQLSFSGQIFSKSSTAKCGTARFSKHETQTWKPSEELTLKFRGISVSEIING